MTSKRNYPVGSDFFIRNRKKLLERLPAGSLAILHSNDELLRNGDQDYPFRQNSDLFYLTGLVQEKTLLALCPGHPDEELREIVFTLQPNEKLETWTGHKYTPDEIRETSGVTTVKWLEEYEGVIRNLAVLSKVIFLNTNEYPKYTTDVRYRNERAAEKLKREYPLHEYARLAPILAELRMVKEPEEIDCMRQASELTGKAFGRVLKELKPGMMEYEIEAGITYEFLKNGRHKHAYAPIIASGRNGLALHYTENSGVCRDGDMLLMDFGAEFNHYAADCSRTVPVNGKFTKRQRECYEAVLEIFKEGRKLLVPGNTIRDINREVQLMMEKKLSGLGLVSEQELKKQEKPGSLAGKYLMHGVSHFIGLDVHDVGSIYETLRKGMVLTFEPGLYIQKEGLAIRIENDVMVDTPPVDLMESIPVEIDDIESLMNI